MVLQTPGRPHTMVYNPFQKFAALKEKHNKKKFQKQLVRLYLNRLIYKITIFLILSTQNPIGTSKYQ